MIEWEETDGGLYVVDADNAELRVSIDGSVVGSRHGSVPRPVDETVVARASEIRLPHAVVYAFPLGDDRQYELDPTGGTLSLPPGEYVVDVDTEIKTYVRFTGRATLERTADFDSVVVSFPEPRRAVLGFRSRHELPADTITVPRTPAGLATAITHAACAHKTDGPDRSYPTLRGHPPLLEFGEDREVPERVRAETPDTGIELHVPPEWSTLVVTAPLAYYLGATVRTGDVEAPTLAVPELGRKRTLSPMPDLEREVERLLRKVFFLDCLVRNAGPYGTTLAEYSLLGALEVDAAALYAASPDERLAAYLEVPHAAVEHRLPAWHLSTYLEPTGESLETLPFLLDRLSLVFTPRTSELEAEELVERSLEDFYRGPGDVASVEVLKPELRAGRAHGWLAEGVPIDVFKATPTAFRNRFRYLERASDGTSICVVVNDSGMATELTDVARTCRERASDLSIDVTVEESLTTAELARTFETDHDFLHYIGHCEEDGLRCPDGYLSTASLSESAVQTFFLNACGSFYEGLDLVEMGSVAGAVTLSQVLDDHALKVGTTFAKLLVYGFSIERALEIARRRIMMGKDYTVVGDGTHSLVQGEHRLPPTAWIDRLEEGGYSLSLSCYSTSVAGCYYVPHVEENEYAYLCGTDSVFTLDENELEAFLEGTEMPAVYDGDVYWSTELPRSIAQGPP